MLITVCGSRKHDNLIQKIKQVLIEYSFDVIFPNLDITNFDDRAIRGVMIANYSRIEKSDIIIIIASNDMGSSTIMELGIAFCLKKHIIAFGIDDDDDRSVLYDEVIPLYLDDYDSKKEDDAIYELINILKNLKYVQNH